MSWQSAFRNIKLASRFTTRQRDRDGTRHLRRSLFARPIVGHRRTRRRAPSFLSLALPGLVAGLLGLPRLLGPVAPLTGWMVSLALAACVVFALRALTSPGPRAPRAVAFLICIAYPVAAIALA